MFEQLARLLKQMKIVDDAATRFVLCCHPRLAVAAVAAANRCCHLVFISHHETALLVMHAVAAVHRS